MNQKIKQHPNSLFAVVIILLTSILLIITLFGKSAYGKSHQQQLTKSQVEQDFAQLYKDLQMAHYNLFANTSKPVFDAAYQQWQNKIKEAFKRESLMSLHDTSVLFQQFMALANIAHSRIDLPVQSFSEYLQNGGGMFPMFFRLKGNDAFIDTVYIDDPDLQPGFQILSINQRPVASWLSTIRSFISADNQTLSNTIIENTLPFYIWLNAETTKTWNIVVKTPEGKKQIEAHAVTNAQRDEFSLSASQKQEHGSRHAEVMAGNIGYLRPGPFYNTQPGAKDVWDNSQFVAFIDNAFVNFLDKDVKALLVDLRNNPGGTNSFSDPVIAWFANQPFKFASKFVIKVSPQSVAANNKRLEVSGRNDVTSSQLKTFYDSHESGETFAMTLPNAKPREGKRLTKPVYVLINRYSYSNAASFAAIVKDYGFGTVIGEKTADFATTYGAMEHFDLQHSGITVGYPKALIIRPNGDTKPGVVIPDISLNSEADLLEQALAYISTSH